MLLLFKVKIYLTILLSVQSISANTVLDVAIPTSSMENTLETGSSLIAVKKEYMGSVDRGDAIIMMQQYPIKYMNASKLNRVIL